MARRCAGLVAAHSSIASAAASMARSTSERVAAATVAIGLPVTFEVVLKVRPELAGLHRPSMSSSTSQRFSLTAQLLALVGLESRMVTAEMSLGSHVIDGPAPQTPRRL